MSNEKGKNQDGFIDDDLAKEMAMSDRLGLEIENQRPPMEDPLSKYDLKHIKKIIREGKSYELDRTQHADYGDDLHQKKSFVAAWNCLPSYRRTKISRMMEFYTNPQWHEYQEGADFVEDLLVVLDGLEHAECIAVAIAQHFGRYELDQLKEIGLQEPVTNYPLRVYLCNRLLALKCSYGDLPMHISGKFYGPSMFEQDVTTGWFGRPRWFNPLIRTQHWGWLFRMPCFVLLQWLEGLEQWYVERLHFSPHERKHFFACAQFEVCVDEVDVREMVWGYRPSRPHIFDKFTGLLLNRMNITKTCGWNEELSSRIVKEWRKTNKWQFDPDKDLADKRGYLKYNNVAQRIVQMQYQFDENSSTPSTQGADFGCQTIWPKMSRGVTAVPATRDRGIGVIPKTKEKSIQLGVDALEFRSMAESAGAVLKDAFVSHMSKNFHHLIKQLNIINWTLLGVSVCQLILFIVDFSLNGWSAVRFANMGLSLFVLATEIMIAFKLNSASTTRLMDFVSEVVSAIMQPNQQNESEPGEPTYYEDATAAIGAIDDEIAVEQIIRNVQENWQPRHGGGLTMADFMPSTIVEPDPEQAEKKLPNETVFQFEYQRTNAATPKDNREKERVPKKVEKEEQALSVETCLKLVCGVLALGTSIAGLKYDGINSFQKRYVNSSRFADALTRNVSGVQDLVGTIAQEAFGYSMSGYDVVVGNIKKSLAHLADFHRRPNIDFSSNPPLFYQYRDAIAEAEATVKDLHRPFSQLPTSVTTMITSLSTAVSAARTHFASVQRAVSSEHPRTETLIVHLVGKPAAGKTWITNNCIIPYLAKKYGWAKEPYSINFADQVYWKPYKGQEIAVYDEFLVRRDEDPMIGYVNLIGSTGYVNLPGAELHDKVQACNFKIMFLISNVHYFNLRNKLTAQGEEALYSRLLRFEVVNKDQKDGLDRSQVPRKPDYSNMEFRRFKAAATTGMPMGQANPGEYDTLTLDEMLGDLCERIDIKAVEFEKMRKEREQIVGSTVKEEQSDSVQHHTYLFYGEPGAGKTELARKVARRLARIMRLDVHDITVQNFSLDKVYDQRAIFVIHDRLADEQAYSNFYDSLPAPSVILLTSNVEVCRAGMLSTYMSNRRTEGMNLRNRAASLGANLYDAWKNRCSWVYQYRSVNPEPGFIRRIGIPGPLMHRGTRSYRSYDTGGVIHCVPGFRTLYTGKLDDKIVHGQEVNESEITDRIFEAYRRYLTNQCDIRIIKANEDFSVPAGDVMIQTTTHKELFDMCANTTNIINAWFNGRHARKPYVLLTSQVENSTFNFKPDMFILRKSKDIAEIIEMAKRTYAVLRAANDTFTVSIEAGDFKAYASKGTIKWYSSSTDCTIRWYEWRHSGDNRYIEVIQKSSNGSGDPQIVEMRHYPTQQVIYGLVNGFHTIPSVERAVCEYLMSCSDDILSRREHKIIIEQAKVAHVSLQGVSAKKEEFEVKWNNFINLSPWYKLMIAFCGIAVAIGAVLAIVGLVRWAVDKSPPRTGKVIENKKTIRFQGWEATNIEYRCTDEVTKEYSAIVRIGNAALNGDQTLKEDWKTTGMSEKFDVLIENDFTTVIKDEDSWLSNISYLHEQALYTSEGKRKGQKKDRSKVAAKFVRNEVKQDQAFYNSNFTDPSTTAIRQKVLRNQCKVFTHGGASTFALRVKDRFALTPGHIWGQEGEMGIIRVPEYGTENQYQVQCVLIDRDYDTAVVHCFDKKLNSCPDIIPYFHRREMSPRVMQGVLVKIDSSKAISDSEWYKKNVISMPGFLQRVCSPASRDGEERLHMYSYEKFHGLSIPTVAGDCGQPYFCTQKEFGSNILLGLHVSRSVQGNSTDLSALDTEMVAAWIVEATKRVSHGVLPRKDKSERILQDLKPSLISSLLGDISTYPFIPPEHPPAMKTYAPMVIDEAYADWIYGLREIDEEEYKPLTWSKENPNSNLLYIGYDPNHTPSYLGKPSHIRTPWSENLAIPNQVLPSVVSYQQLPPERREQLPRINKRPSVVLEQVSFYNDPFKWGPLQEKLLGHAAMLLQKKYSEWYRGPHRVLTELEAINGLVINPREQWYDGLQGLDLQSSAGDFPKRFFHVTKKGELLRPLPQVEGDKQLYTWGTTDAAQAVQLRKKILEHLALTGQHLITPMQDNLKRELVKPGKSRCFQSLTMEETVFIRKYTGTIQAAVMKNHVRAYCQVGVDPYVEFHTLRDRFSQVSLVGEAGDFTRFDKHLLGPIIHQALMIYWQVWRENQREPIQDLEGFHNVWKVIANLTINSVSVADGLVYMKIRGNPSGNPLTSILNSTVNELYEYMFVIYQVQQLHIRNSIDSSKLTLEMQNLCKHKTTTKTLDVALSELDGATYGDDCLWVFRPRWQSVLGFNEKKKFLAEHLGISYDTPEKDGSTYESRPLESMSFLSRTFSVQQGVVFPRLKISTINSYFHWTTSMAPNQIEQLMQDAFAEAALYPRDDYQSWIDAWRIIDSWFRERGVHLNFSPLGWNSARVRAQNIILHGRDVAYSYPENIQEELFTSSSLSVYREDLVSEYSENIRDDEFTTEKRLVILQCAQIGNMAQEIVCAEIDRMMRDVSMSTLKLREIKEYRPYPAYIELLTDNYYSVVFDLIDTTKTNFSNLQSDTMKIINIAVSDDIKLDLLKVTYVSRRLQIAQPLVRAAQILLHVIPKVGSRRWNPKQNVGQRLAEAFEKTTITQASGTSEVPNITQASDGGSSNAIMLPVQDNHVAPKALEASLWHYDLKELAHREMETVNSPIEIPVDTPAGTIVDIVSLGELGVMSPAMRLWASVNSETNATMWMKYEFVTAATIINSLRVGVVRERKATYTPQELQLIKWYDINPQDNCISFPLRLAATDETQKIPNRYSFSETIAAGTFIPTIVLMTRTVIQNSYQNTAVSVNLKRFAWFQNETGGASAFRTTAEDLNAGFPTTTALTRARGGQSLSTLLNLSPGRPFHIVCDGAMTMRPNNNFGKTLDVFDPIWHKTTVNRLGPPIRTAPLNAIVACCDIQYELQLGVATQFFDNAPTWDAQLTTDDKSWSGLGWRRTLTYNSTAPAFMVPFLDNDEVRFANNNASHSTRMLAISAWTAESYEGRRTNELISDFWRTEMPNPRSFWVFWSMNGSPIPGIEFSINQLYNPASTTLAQDVYDEFMSVWKSVLEAQGWDIVQTSVELTGLTLSSNNIVTDSYTGYDINSQIDSEGWQGTHIVSYKQTSWADPAFPRPVDTRDTLWASEWPESTKYLIKLYHPDIGTHYVFAALRDKPIRNNSTDPLSLRPQNQPTCFVGTCSRNSSHGNHDQNFIVSGRMETHTTIANMPLLEQLITRTFDISVSGDVTLAPVQSRVVFTPSVPSTLTTTIAESLAGTEMHDTLFHSSFHQWLLNQGVSESQTVRFSLSNTANTYIFATVTYDMFRRYFYIVNNPSSNEDRYRAYPKLTYEQVVLFNLQILSTNIPTGQATNTQSWVSRVVSDTSRKVFNGNFIGSAGVSIASRVRKTMVNQAEEVAMAASGAMSGLSQALLQLLFGNKRFQQLSDFQKQQFENDLSLLKAKYSGEQELIQKRADVNSLQAGVAQQQAAQSTMIPPSAVTPAGKSYLKEFLQAQDNDPAPTDASSAPSVEVSEPSVVDKLANCPEQGGDLGAANLPLGTVSPPEGANSGTQPSKVFYNSSFKGKTMDSGVLKSSQARRPFVTPAIHPLQSGPSYAWTSSQGYDPFKGEKQIVL